jgi:hypothetical protein
MNTIKGVILEYVKENPNTSPKYIIDTLVSHGLDPGLIAGIICVMRESDKSLIVTGKDDNGVLLSVTENKE